MRQNTSEQNMLNGSEIWFGIEKNEGNIMDIKKEYERWLANATADADVAAELKTLDDAKIEDAFYRDLAFGTGGLRGVIGAGTNRMNIYTVAKASQGLADYLKKNYAEPSVAIGYDSRIKSDVFAKVAAGVFAANGVKVNIWPVLMPVPTVSFATRYLHTSAGVMVTASHNPSKYNGYKVYGVDGCQITTEAAAEILAEIEKLDIFADVKTGDFEAGVENGSIQYIPDEVYTAFVEQVKRQHKNRCGTGVYFFDVACALDLDNQNDRDAKLHAALDLTAQGAIVVLAIFRVLDNLVMGQVILKIRHRHKVVVDAVLLALARGSGGGGDGVLDLRVLFQQCGHDGILASAGGAGDNKQIFFTFHRYFLFSSVSSAARPVMLSSGMPDNMTWSESMMSTA